ncbi:hypothetical protein [Actinophytocola sp.]|uniref:hypothetical protein n=1 Tax=Actinophytocola sp. TaxID=1872138 RepID=UPI002D810B89|nr:hypothetical protein [Actinophytocola sp.]HET9142346.1 hypothetical protein [Actinophytocola sp.]
MAESADQQVQIDWSQLPTLSAHWEASGNDDYLAQHLGIDLSQDQGQDQSVQIDWNQLPTLSAHWQVQGDDSALQQQLGIDMSQDAQA